MLVPSWPAKSEGGIKISTFNHNSKMLHIRQARAERFGRSEKEREWASREFLLRFQKSGIDPERGVGLKSRCFNKCAEVKKIEGKRCVLLSPARTLPAPGAKSVRGSLYARGYRKVKGVRSSLEGKKICPSGSAEKVRGVRPA